MTVFLFVIVSFCCCYVQVVKVVRELMMEMDKYQIRYHSFPVNIDTSSRLSLSLFFAVRTYYLTVRDNLSDR